MTPVLLWSKKGLARMVTITKRGEVKRQLIIFVEE